MSERRFTVQSAVALHFGMNADEVRPHRYPPPTPCPVFMIGGEWYTATQTQEAPKSNQSWAWTKVPSRITDFRGWHLWRRVRHQRQAWADRPRAIQ